MNPVADRSDAPLTDAARAAAPADAPDEAGEVMHVTDALYDALVANARRMRERTDAPDPALHDAARTLLYAEARLIDDRRYEDWLGLFTRDCIYWIPASTEVIDPRRAAQVHFDDHRRLTDRIALIRTGFLHAQSPASRTRREISNIEVWPEADGTLQVRSNVVIWTWRPMPGYKPYVAWQTHTLVPQPTRLNAGGGYRIRYKTLNLLECDAPLGNTTFML